MIILKSTQQEVFILNRGTTAAPLPQGYHHVLIPYTELENRNKRYWHGKNGRISPCKKGHISLVHDRNLVTKDK